MDLWMDGWMGGWMDLWMDGWMGGWMGGWMNGQMNGRTYRKRERQRERQSANNFIIRSEKVLHKNIDHANVSLFPLLISNIFHSYNKGIGQDNRVI